MAVNGKPMKAKSPENHADFRGSSCEFAVTSYPAGTTNPAQIAGKTALSESGGAPGGAIGSDCGSVGQLRQQALEDLQRAWKSLRRLEDQSDSPAESKAAGRAVKHVDKAFRELESKR